MARFRRETGKAQILCSIVDISLVRTLLDKLTPQVNLPLPWPFFYPQKWAISHGGTGYFPIL